MNSRKRQAPEELLPLRSAKQPRTSRVCCTGETASPSQNEGILARWRQLAHELYTLSFETLGQLVPGVLKARPLSTPAPSAPTTAPPNPTPAAPPPARPPPARPPTSHQSAEKAKPPAPQPTAGPSKTHIEPRSTRSVPSKQSSTSPPKQSSVPPKQTSDIQTLYPEISAALTSNERHKASAENRKRIPRREHIFAKNHKAQVAMERKKEREQMIKELYTIRRMAGYGSDFQTFQSYLNYRARLELLERREALSPSPSLTDLRTKSSATRKERRHSTSDYIETDFLTRSLEKARETLNSPKPPKPFIPSFDQLRISTRAKDEAIERALRSKRQPLPTSLPPEDEAQVASFLANTAFQVKCDRQQVNHGDLLRLRPAQWLNDEIINFWGAMIMARWLGEKENRKKETQGNTVNGKGAARELVDVHFFNSFFWTKLSTQGYTKARLHKWTKDIDVFAKDVIVLPVNHNNSHWTAAAINLRKKRIEAYDSMGFTGNIVFKALRDFLDAEHRHRKSQPFDFDGWENYTLSSTPQQENGYDCGVFTCQFMETLSRGQETFNFTQADMLYLRKRMIWEIGNTKFRDD